MTMPLIHNRSFWIRHYECDAYGHVNNANYLRYMQEAAFDASAAAGYSRARYAELGRQWLARETHIEYLQPLGYGDSVRVKTWVVDFRRTTTRRFYEFYCGDDLRARAHTDWVFLDTTTGQPARIPPDLITTLLPEGRPNPRPQREKFPVTPSPPPGVFSMRRRVTWQDIGPAQHVNNAVYLAYIDDCGIEVAAAYDWPVERMTAAGFAIIVRRHRIQYRQPARLNDELEVATWVSDVKRATAIRHYTITRAGDETLIARVHTLYVWVDITTGQPLRISPQFLADFAPNIVHPNDNWK
jgi:acyl-CoA thioester hydrolase